MDSKSKQTTASSSPINDGGAEVVDNSNSMDHWSFLEEIEAPMWADLSECNLMNDETDDPWFNISHEFHQCSSSQLISTVFHPTKSTNIQEPPSPKLPASVSKSRGKNYKIKQWEQKKGKAIPNKQHPVKNLTRKPSMNTGSNNKLNPIFRTVKLKENEGPKASSSCGSNTSNFANQEHENSAGSTLTSDHSTNQEKKCFEVSFQTSGETSKLLSSLRNSLRRSYAARPAARAVVVNSGPCSEGSSSNSSAGQPSSDNKLRTSKSPALYTESSFNRQGTSMLASKGTTKGKVQQNASVRKALMPLNMNKQNIRMGKENEELRIGRRTASLAVIKEKASATIATCQNGKTAPPAVGCVQKVSKQSMTQNNGTKKLTGLKEKPTNRSKDKDATKPARKVHFR